MAAVLPTADPGLDFRGELCELLRAAPENRLLDFPGTRIFDEPIVGVADGDDPLFAVFRRVVGPAHFLPRELLAACCPAADLACVRVVAWAFPFAAAVRKSNRAVDFPSPLYSLARNNGAAWMEQLAGRLAERLQARGWAAVVPSAREDYTAYRCPELTFSSTWSERHAAFAAGLGRFGLSRALLTPVGSNVRLGSLITNLPLPVTPRDGDEHRAPCLASGGKTCGRCIARCPAGAISSAGMDKTRCYEMRRQIRDRCLDEYVGKMHLIPSTVATSGRRNSGYSLGCALCQCGVPCEGTAPETERAAGDPVRT